MNPQQTVDNAKQKFASVIEHYLDQLKTLRTGRASASMLDNVTVDVYGAPMPLLHIANVTAPEAQLLQITPFDPSNLQKIASAIRDNPNLGLNPSDDGRVVRIPVPALNEERRREIVKQLGARQEEAMIALRNVRHEALDAFDEAKKNKIIGEDEDKRLVGLVEDAMKNARADVEAATKAKDAEIMKV